MPCLLPVHPPAIMYFFGRRSHPKLPARTHTPQSLDNIRTLLNVANAAGLALDLWKDSALGRLVEITEVGRFDSASVHFWLG